MIVRRLLLTSLLTLSSLSVSAQSIGWNLAPNEDFGTSVHFVDVFKNVSAWRTRNADGTGGFDTRLGEGVSVDALGWPTEVPAVIEGSAPQMVHTLVDLNIAGDYTLIFDGSGTIRLRGVAGWVEIESEGGETERTIAMSDTGRLFIEILRSDADDPIRNIRLILPGFEEVYETSPFHPNFVTELAAFEGPIRTMDWGRTNGNTVETWGDRTPENYYTQTVATGVAYEYQVELANATGRDLWFCVPASADDDFIESLATFLRERLNPGLQLWLEYSNETWNTAWQFPQTRVVNDRGLERGFYTTEEQRALAGNPWVSIWNTAGYRYHVYRTAQIWAAFEDNWGSEAFSARVRRVMPGQAYNTWLNEIRLAALHNNESYQPIVTTMDPETGETTYRREGDAVELNPRGYRAEYLAVAPYFLVNYSDEDAQAEGGVPTVEEILADARESVESEEPSRPSIRSVSAALAENQATARMFGVGLLAHEAGQSLRAVGDANRVWPTLSEPAPGAPNYDELLEAYEAEQTAIANRLSLIENLHEANRHAEMYELYLTYLNLFCEYGFEHVNHFNFVEESTSFGSWGAREHHDEGVEDSPKYRALSEWNDGLHGCDMPPLGPDMDRDGIPNISDADADGDGIPNEVECPISTDCVDTDDDGAPDYLDMDSDGDGIMDAIEATDANADGVADLIASGTDQDRDGIDDAFDADCAAVGDCGGVIGAPPMLPDFDEDDAPDYIDRDDDADGISTAQELRDAEAYMGSAEDAHDVDGDGQPNYLDADSDGDGSLDLTEDDRPDGTGDRDRNGVLDYLDPTTVPADSDGDGVPDALECPGHTIPNADCVDTDMDGTPDYQDVDDDDDGLLTAVEFGIRDTEGGADWDNDGVPNHLDLDSDNDGISDLAENGGARFDRDGDAMIDSGRDSDGDGLHPAFDADDSDPENTEVMHPPVNTDDEGNPDFLDLDSDNDGLFDAFEAHGMDTDRDGLIDGFTDSDEDGLADAVLSRPFDTDMDGTANFQEVDSDADGLSDLLESRDADRDGVPDQMPSGMDTDRDGIDDAFEASAPTLLDTDEDAMEDWRDADDDGDGVGTRFETPEGDTDADGLSDHLDTDDDGDGVLTIFEAADPDGDSDPSDARDTDDDALPDYLDADDDGDGVATEFERPDPNGDGNPSDARDTDLDEAPDYLDADDDGDGVDTIHESADPNGDLNPEDALDSNEDGAPDYLDPVLEGGVGGEGGSSGGAFCCTAGPHQRGGAAFLGMLMIGLSLRRRR